MAPMTAEELQKHPEYEHTIWKLTPTQEGKVAVAKDRGGPINIAYEVHGHGERKLVVSSIQTLSHSRRQVLECYCCLTIEVAGGSDLHSRFVSVALTVSALVLVSHIFKSTFRDKRLVRAISRFSYPPYSGCTCFYTFSNLLHTSIKYFLTWRQWVMGLGGMKYAWQRQTKDFGHAQGDKYSCLVYDNRGIGDSDKPRGRYSTSEMAKDVIEVIDHLGWTNDRQLHVIGISMGGMIAQEVVSPSLHICFESCTMYASSNPHFCVR